jgi:hypothetical protein
MTTLSMTPGGSYVEERVTLLDVIGMGMRRNTRATLVYLCNSLFWFGLACVAGWLTEVVWEDNRDHNKFDLAMWIICPVCFGYMFMSMKFPSILGLHPTGPFRRATYAFLAPLASKDKCCSDLSAGWFWRWMQRTALCCMLCMKTKERGVLIQNGVEYPIPDAEEQSLTEEEQKAMIDKGFVHLPEIVVRNRVRSVVYTTHMVYVVLVLVVWGILSMDSDDPTSFHVRFKAHMETIRLLNYLWVLVVPTFAGSVVDGIQLHTTKYDSAHVFHRMLFASYALLVKFALCVNLIVLLDPAANYFFAIDSNNTTTELAVLWSVSSALLLIVVCFWTSYDCLHDTEERKSPEKVFAFVEFPAFLSLVLKSAWQFSGQIRKQHDDVSHQAVGGDFVCFASFAILMTLSVLSLPAHIDYSRDVELIDSGQVIRITTTTATKRVNPFTDYTDHKPLTSWKGAPI